MNQKDDGLMRLPFAAEEFAQRREKIREQMHRRGMDAVLVSGGPNFFYLTGMPIAVSLGVFTLLLRKDGQGF